MKRPFVGFLLLVIAAILLWQRQPEQDGQMVRQVFFALGTQFTISIVATEPETAKRATVAINQAKAMLKDFNQRWHPWLNPNPAQPGIPSLSGINQKLSQTGTADIGHELRPLIQRSFDLREQSSGRFDPTIGHIVKLWGFDDENHFRSAPPADADVLAATQVPTLNWLEPTISGDVPNTRQLDLGAIAKGYAVDLIIEQLKKADLNNALVNAGGDLRVIGNPPGRQWKIGIRNPRPELAPSANQAPIAAIELRPGEAIFTSGDYERFFVHDGRRYHHIIDPRTGWPAQGVRSLTVIAEDATLADAAATALMIAREDQWEAVASDLGIRYVLRIDEKGIWHSTAAMQERLILPSPDTP